MAELMRHNVAGKFRRKKQQFCVQGYSSPARAAFHFSLQAYICTLKIS